MKRRLLFAALAAIASVFCALPQVSGAHQSNPNFSSTVTGFAPANAGLTGSILGGDDQVSLNNRGNANVIVLGYEKEPFLWMKPGGAVLINQNSPAKYLNEDRFGTTTVPKTASAKATPDWKTVARNGRWDWHDHRMHWMSTQNPSAVTDRSKRTKIFDWEIPLKVNGASGAIDGNLYWVGEISPNPPAGPAALVYGGFVLIMLFAGAFVLIRRARRSDDDESEPTDQPKADAW